MVILLSDLLQFLSEIDYIIFKLVYFVMFLNYLGCFVADAQSWRSFVCNIVMLLSVTYTPIHLTKILGLFNTFPDRIKTRILLVLIR
jgi:hypothetical protein